MLKTRPAKAVLCALLWIVTFPIAVARANVVLTGCTGAVFIMPGMTETRNGLVLTNGHCLGMGSYEWNGLRFLQPNQVLIDHDLGAGAFAVTIFTNRGEGGNKYPALKILFGAMTVTDLAIIELDVTYSELREQGYKIYKIAKDIPKTGTRLDFISYFENFNGQCAVREITPTVVEGPYIWTNVVKMNLSKSCRVYPGVSGTPGIVRGSDEIYAIGNTEYTGIGEDCAIMNPCELDANSGRLRHGAPTQTYAIATAPLHGCYDTIASRFDFSLTTCRLKK